MKRSTERLGEATGWASIALGLPMTTVPGRLLEAIGLPDDDKARAWTVAVGVREYAGAATLLAMRHYQVGTWARVMGDVMDLTLLASGWGKARDRARLQTAMGTVGAFLAIDLFTAVKATRESTGRTPKPVPTPETHTGPTEASGSTHVRKSLTIRLPEDEVRQHWRQYEWTALDPQELESTGDVRFVPAPGSRGTEIHIDHEPATSALAAKLSKLVGIAPDQLIVDELRRFKAFVETGVVVRSEKSPEGPSSRRQLKQHPAQPPTEKKVKQMEGRS